MLYRFLKAIQSGRMQSLQEIARSLGIPVDMAFQIARDLTSKGYLQEAGLDCNTPQIGCADCPVSSGCHVNPRHWFLTEKGRRALESLVEARRT